MTDENQAAANELTQQQQDEAAVTALEAKVTQDAADLEQAKTKVEADTKPVAEPDTLAKTIAAGIAQFDGFNEHTDKVTELRELARASAGESTEARDELAKLAQAQFNIEAPTT